MLRKLAAGILCAALTFSLASCKDTTWSYKVEDTTITSGMYITFQMNAYMDAQGLAEDSSKSVLEQKIEGKNAADWINSKVLESAKSYVAVEKKFDELGLTLSDSDKNKINTQLENMWSYYQNVYEPNGAGKQSFKKILQNSYKSNLIFKKYYDEKGLEEVSKADLLKEFTENYALVKYIQMPMKDAKGNKLKTEGKAKLKKKAEAYVARLNKGEKIDDLIKEYEKILEKEKNAANSTSSNSTSSGSASSSASSAAASSAVSSAPVSSAAVSSAAATSSGSASSGSASSGSASSGTTSSGSKEEEKTDPNEVMIYKENETLTKKFKDGIFGAKNGVPTIVEDDENYYVTIRYDLSKNEKRFKDYHDTLLQNLKGDEFKEKLNTWSKDYKVETNADSEKRYTLKKIKFPSYS